MLLHHPECSRVLLLTRCQNDDGLQPNLGRRRLDLALQGAELGGRAGPFRTP
jgi:hypothetical protein